MPSDPTEKAYYKSVAAVAIERHLPLHVPEDINTPEMVAEIRNLSPDLIAVVSYRQILGKPIIDIPAWGVINLHGALLPKYRGASPINWVLINGEVETGVTIHFIDEGVDTGDIIAQRTIPVAFDDDAVTLFEKITTVGVELFEEVIGHFAAGRVPRRPNRKELGSYFRRRRPEQGAIKWQGDALSVYNTIRALVPPFPGAFTYLGSTRIVIEAGAPIALRSALARPGEVFYIRSLRRHAIAAGHDAILPLILRVEDGPPEAADVVLSKLRVTEGTVFTERACAPDQALSGSM